jgi:hypothetical protein
MLNTNFTRSLAPKWRFNASLSFLDSRYDWYYYQDYAILNLNLLYVMTRSFSTHVSLGVSHQMINNFGWSFTPSAGIESDQGSWYWLVGLSFTQANGSPAQFSTQGGVTRVVNGVLDSRYQALQARAGIGKKLGGGFDAFLQLIYTGTKYRSEGAPVGSAFSLDRRADQDGSLALNLSKSLIPKRLNLILSTSYGINTSSGFQGLILNGYAPDYNYHRFLSSLTLAYGI